jgi:hypothetical protein
MARGRERLTSRTGSSGGDGARTRRRASTTSQNPARSRSRSRGGTAPAASTPAWGSPRIDHSYTRGIEAIWEHVLPEGLRGSENRVYTELFVVHDRRRKAFTAVLSKNMPRWERGFEYVPELSLRLPPLPVARYTPEALDAAFKHFLAHVESLRDDPQPQAVDAYFESEDEWRQRRKAAKARYSKRLWSPPAIGWSKHDARLISAEWTPTSGESHPYDGMTLTVAHQPKGKRMVALLMVSGPTALGPGMPVRLQALAVTPVTRYSEKRLRAAFVDALARVERVLDDPNPKALRRFLTALAKEYKESGSLLST